MLCSVGVCFDNHLAMKKDKKCGKIVRLDSRKKFVLYICFEKTERVQYFVTKRLSLDRHDGKALAAETAWQRRSCLINQTGVCARDRNNSRERVCC